MFRSPERPTFVNSDKSRQKHRKEPPVPSPPGALYSVRTCDCIPHVHEGFLFCLVKRIVSAPAPLPLMPTPNSAFSSTVASHERQRRKTGANASYVTKSNISRERAVNGHKFAMSTACRKSRNLGFWLSFWSLLGQRPKVTRPGGRNSPHTKIKVNIRSGSY